MGELVSWSAYAVGSEVADVKKKLLTKLLLEAPPRYEIVCRWSDVVYQYMTEEGIIVV